MSRGRKGTLKDAPNAVVVVPTHTAQLNDDQEKSLTQCISVLGNHDIYLAHPASLDVSAVVSRFGVRNTQSFPDQCFASYRDYNRTIRSAYFYAPFRDWDFLLLHELDAFVFADELQYWCGRGFDYIGAPLGPPPPSAYDYCRSGYWPLTYRLFGALTNKKRKGMQLLNGGFSLRRIQPFYETAKRNAKKVSLWGKNDDLFWSMLGPIYRPGIKMPPPEVASRFSLMLDSKYWIERNGGRLPFGCHGWPRYETEFWLSVIEATPGQERRPANKCVVTHMESR